MDLRLLVLLIAITLVNSKLVRLTCKEIREIVDGHNSRREEIMNGELEGQPQATEMNLLVWDRELELKATKWALQNKYEHNPDRTIPSGRFETGENWYWTSTTDAAFKIDPEDALKSWYDENKNYQFGPLQMSQFESSIEIGHYTQMIWSNTTYVGCGISESTKNGWHTFFVVCNYGPAGNVIGQAPYKTDGERKDHLSCGSHNCNRKYGDLCSII